MPPDDDNSSGYDAFRDPSIPSEELLKMVMRELRHPLNSIEGCASILELPELKEENRPDIIGLIHRNVEVMLKKIEFTLAYIEERKQLDDMQNDAEG